MGCRMIFEKVNISISFDKKMIMTKQSKGSTSLTRSTDQHDLIRPTITNKNDATKNLQETYKIGKITFTFGRVGCCR